MIPPNPRILPLIIPLQAPMEGHPSHWILSMPNLTLGEMILIWVLKSRDFSLPKLTQTYVLTSLGRFSYSHIPDPSPEEKSLLESVSFRLQRLPLNRSILALEKLVDDIWTLSEMRDRRYRVTRHIVGCAYREDLHSAQDRIAELVPEAFRQPVEPAIESEILGYKMPSYHQEFKFPHGIYFDYRQAWLREDQLSPEELYKWLEDNCCSDWSKQDQNGECFGGYWTYPEDSPEYENRWELTRETNLRALTVLPYPSRAIIMSVNMGCANRQESVAYTVLCCEWVRRKMEQMKDIPPSSYLFEEDEDDARP